MTKFAELDAHNSSGTPIQATLRHLAPERHCRLDEIPQSKMRGTGVGLNNPGTRVQRGWALDRTEIKLRIGYALSDRLVPIACAIIENSAQPSWSGNCHPQPLRQSGWQAKNNTAWIAPERLLSAPYKGVTAALGALSMAPSIGLCADPGHSPGLTGPGDEQNSTGCFYVGTYGMSDVGLRQEAVGADRIQAYLDRHQHTKSCAAAPGFMWMSCESC
jgi:hypothetical protein